MTFTQQELDRLSTAIKEVERGTSGELRLVVVGQSTPTSHVFPILSLAFVSLVLITLWSADVPDQPWLAPFAMVAAVLLAVFLSRFGAVQRALTSRADMEREAWERAELEFYREGLGATTGKTGVLLLLSHLEHQAVVLADKGIASKLDKNIWKEVVDLIIEGQKSGRAVEKLEEAIRLCGKLLAAHFPAQAGDINELPNHVVVKP